MTNFDRKNGILFAISLIAFLLIFFINANWCWVALPFVFTFFVEMLGWLR